MQVENGSKKEVRNTINRAIFILGGLSQNIIQAATEFDETGETQILVPIEFELATLLKGLTDVRLQAEKEHDKKRTRQD